ncbi:MAG: hypothetical protein COA50_05680 [Flavobacteriaceae bacterium]|nr:MAG: hypothetical protein COA50_05680 [Flavobacteriaceae bacterium]
MFYATGQRYIKLEIMNMGYIIENYSILDKENYIPPVKVINEALAKYNGKFLVATPKAETLSGNPLEVVIVMEFDSVESAKSFYMSDDYKEYKDLFNNTTQGWVLLSGGYNN